MIGELNPFDPMFSRVASWENRAVNLVDPRDTRLTDFYGRVALAVQELLGRVLQVLNTRFANDPSASGQIAIIRQILDTVAAKS